ncbi:MAG: nucleotidyltransferase [Lachnospiraceae bacterium]|nr:nucleotidyltransferase [Lachnospiraceae bacterium]
MANKTALVIMAAGMGSRYGTGIKQLEHVGTSGEIIMEYSIYDAIRAGFDKVVFITRRELYDEFKKIIPQEIYDKVEVEYVFQELTKLPEGFTCPADRAKPWGTGHAILSCLGTIKEPFAVINADDYYGREGFEKLHDFLANVDVNKKNPSDYAMVGFVLRNTLSENGKVTRGACAVSDKGTLTSVRETYEIYDDNGIGRALDGNNNEITLSLDTPVSMNMWGFTPSFLDTLEERFKDFLSKMANPLKAEFLLPEVVGDMVDEGVAEVHVLHSKDKWFGVTYHEDKDYVVKSFRELCDKGVYPEKLFK